MPVPKRILLVEDEAECVRRVEGFLSAKGYEVQVVTNGHEALQKAREISPSLIILDVVLPKMSGYQVARLLKFDEKFKGIPILMLTVLDQPLDKEKAKAVGVDLYLTKPVADDELLKAVEKLLGL